MKSEGLQSGLEKSITTRATLVITVCIQALTIYVEVSGVYWSQGVCFDDLDLEQAVGVDHEGYVSSVAHGASKLQSSGLIVAKEAQRWSKRRPPPRPATNEEVSQTATGFPPNEGRLSA